MTALTRQQVSAHAFEKEGAAHAERNALAKSQRAALEQGVPIEAAMRTVVRELASNPTERVAAAVCGARGCRRRGRRSWGEQRFRRCSWREQRFGRCSWRGRLYRRDRARRGKGGASPRTPPACYAEATALRQAGGAKPWPLISHARCG